MDRRDRLLRATEHLLSATVHGTRESSLTRLASALSASLGVRYAMVGELVGQDIAVRALTGCERPDVPSKFALAGSACERISERGLYRYPTRAQQLFPQDPLLHSLRAQSYVGVVLRGRAGRPLGVLAALHDAETNWGDELEDILGL